MGEQHKKHSRREHLNDFHLNVAGEYVYGGALYACQSSEEKQHRIKRAVWGMAAILIVAVIAGGCIPAPGMQNCFYVLLPYLGEFLGAASVIWALAKLGMDWGTVREYNYKKKRGRSARANGGHGGLFGPWHRVRIDLLFRQ